MAEPLKTFFSEALVASLAGELHAAHPSFPRQRFVRAASRGLEEMELLDRARHVARALKEHLPTPYPEALAVVLRALGPAHATDELLGTGMAPFRYLPYTMFVAEHGLDHFDLSMQAQHALTQRFTCEWSLRSYIERDPERTMGILATWARDPSPHVRRLVSEGTRLRLPWGKRVKWLDEHPERVVTLLEALRDDGASAVRRSVANNLNDLSKVHSSLAMQVCARWWKGAGPERRQLVEHALRSAIKRGAPEALAIVGHGEKPKVTVEAVTIAPARPRIGDRAEITWTLRSRARAAQALLVDLRVHFARPTGRPSAKVFKVARATLPAGGTLAMRASVSLAVHTTRKPHPGTHRVEVLINGVAFDGATFELRR